MKKAVRINSSLINTENIRKIYLYRVADFNIDKISLEKHYVTMLNPFDKSGLVAELNDETKVGDIKMKVAADLIPILVKSVDEVMLDFISDEKMIISVNFAGIQTIDM